VIRIRQNAYLDERALSFKASRSRGPGGQNINKVNTQVTVFFDVGRCSSLSGQQKKRILSRLATRADKNGVVRVVCRRFRTQKANRRAALQRLIELLKQALMPVPVRKKTRPPASARRRRLEEKRRRSELKRLRSQRNFEV